MNKLQPACEIVKYSRRLRTDLVAPEAKAAATRYLGRDLQPAARSDCSQLRPLGSLERLTNQMLLVAGDAVWQVNIAPARRRLFDHNWHIANRLPELNTGKSQTDDTAGADIVQPEPAPGARLRASPPGT